MKDLLNKLANSYTLTKEEAKTVLKDIATEKYTEIQIASFLTVYLMRDITPDELLGFKDAMFELSNKIDLSEFNTIDLCGTGGDGKDTFNISTLSSFIVAGAGEKVVKHGNYGVSSVCGSSNLLEYLGVKFTDNTDKLKQHLDKSGICFLHAPLFHPAMKNIAPIRKSLGVKTIFNLLGPLINPASPNNQLVGVYNLKVAELYNKVFGLSDTNYKVVHSNDGYDEVSLTSDFTLFDRFGKSNRSSHYFYLKKTNAVDIVGGQNVSESAEIFSKIIKGEGTEAQNNVVIANSTLAISCMHPQKSISECVEIASESLFAQKALKSFLSLLNN